MRATSIAALPPPITSTRGPQAAGLPEFAAARKSALSISQGWP